VWAPVASPLNVAEVVDENVSKAALSSRHAKTRLAAIVRLSVPVNVKVTAVAAVVPLGPPVIVVVGGVLSTTTVRVAVAVFVARSVAVARSVCVPSATVRVSQDALAISSAAGGAGAKDGERF